MHIATHKKTFADPLFDRIYNGIRGSSKIDTSNMDWKKYVSSLLLLKFMSCFGRVFYFKNSVIGII